MAVTSAADAEHYTWGGACDGWHLLNSDDHQACSTSVVSAARGRVAERRKHSVPVAREHSGHRTRVSWQAQLEFGRAPSVIEERMPPCACEQRHLHRRARQFFYLLQSKAVPELDGTLHLPRAGQGLHVPPGVPHQMRNGSPADARFLMVSSPRSHGDRIATAGLGNGGASA